MRFSAPGRLADFASVHQRKITADIYEAFGREAPPATPALSSVEMMAVSAFKEAVANDGRPHVIPVSTVITDAGEGAYRSPAPAENIVRSAILQEALASTSIAQAAPAVSSVVGDPGEGFFRTDFPDPWRALLSPQESAVSPAPRPSFVRFVSEDKPLFQ
jgi:hypothetical protein